MKNFDFTKILELLFTWLGPGYTVLLLFILLLAAYIYNREQQKNKEKYIDKALEEKDRTIQRLADEARYYRILHMKSQGYTDEQIDRFIMKNSFENPKDARNKLEN